MGKLALFVVVFVVMILAVGCTAYQTPPSNSQAQPTPAGTAANEVVIQNFAFNPPSLTVKAGDTVTWTNQDLVTHIINSDTFNSADINQGDKFSFTFAQKGTFNYVCGIHPSMKGTIIVQ